MTGSQLDGVPPSRHRDELLAELASNYREVREVNERLAQLRARRQELCRQASDELGCATEAAQLLHVSAWRVQQMRDEALVARTRRPR